MGQKSNALGGMGGAIGAPLLGTWEWEQCLLRDLFFLFFAQRTLSAQSRRPRFPVPSSFIPPFSARPPICRIARGESLPFMFLSWVCVCCLAAVVRICFTKHPAPPPQGKNQPATRPISFAKVPVQLPGWDSRRRTCLNSPNCPSQQLSSQLHIRKSATAPDIGDC